MEYGTTDRCTGGTASADTYYGTDVPAGAFANNGNTTAWYAITTPGHWLKYTFAAGVYWKISKMIMQCPNISVHCGVKNFIVKGGSTTLYTGITVDNTNEQTFTWVNPVAYNDISIFVTDNWDGIANSAYIGEVQLFEGIYPAGGFSGGNPWILIKDMWERHNKLWTPKGLILPKDLGYSY